jgi:hypothetical protein
MRVWVWGFLMILAVRRPAAADDVLGRASLKLAPDRPWTSTKIAVQRGDRLAFTATGKITSGVHKNVGPDGTPGVAEDEAYPLRTANALAVIGRIGDGPAFLIGSKAEVVADRDGVLLVGIDDDAFGDNRGGFTVSVERRAPAPGAAEPGAAATAPTSTGEGLGDTTWNFCGTTHAITFLPDGKLIDSDDTCGAPTWTQHGVEVTFSCNPSVEFVVTLANGALTGNWHSNPGAGVGGVCLTRAPKPSTPAPPASGR